jgi:hypothetical protein
MQPSEGVCVSVWHFGLTRPRPPKTRALNSPGPCLPRPGDVKPELGKVDLWGAFAAPWEAAEPAEPELFAPAPYRASIAH